MHASLPVLALSDAWAPSTQNTESASAARTQTQQSALQKENTDLLFLLNSSHTKPATVPVYYNTSDGFKCGPDDADGGISMETDNVPIGQMTIEACTAACTGTDGQAGVSGKCVGISVYPSAIVPGMYDCWRLSSVHLEKCSKASDCITMTRLTSADEPSCSKPSPRQSFTWNSNTSTSRPLSQPARPPQMTGVQYNTLANNLKTAKADSAAAKSWLLTHLDTVVRPKLQKDKFPAWVKDANASTLLDALTWEFRHQTLLHNAPIYSKHALIQDDSDLNTTLRNGYLQNVCQRYLLGQENQANFVNEGNIMTQFMGYPSFNKRPTLREVNDRVMYLSTNWQKSPGGNFECE
jgi:hypothetical protein